MKKNKALLKKVQSSCKKRFCCNWKITTLVVVVFLLGCFSFASSFYFINKAKEKARSKPIVLGGEDVNMEVLTKTYKNEIKKLLNDFLVLADDFDNSKDQILEYSSMAKKKMLGLTVPGENRDLHIKLLSVFNIVEAGVKEGNYKEVSRGLVMIEELKTQHNWVY